MALLDTTALVDLSRRTSSEHHRRIRTLIIQLIQNGETICTSRINEAEFRVGAYRSIEPERETAKINAVLSAMVILEFDGAAADRFARARAELLDRGRSIASVDLLIASVAIVNGQTLVTRNIRDFIAVPGLNSVAY